MFLRMKCSWVRLAELHFGSLGVLTAVGLCQNAPNLVLVAKFPERENIKTKMQSLPHCLQNWENEMVRKVFSNVCYSLSKIQSI